MSSLIVEVVRIDEIRPHPDPETTRLELAIIKGWQTVIPKAEDAEGNLVSKYQPGDVVIYVPPDAMLPVEVSDRWGVTKYLGSGGRVKSARLRGEMSHGFIAEVEPIEIDGVIRMPEVGENVADSYGIKKYEPPVSFNSEDLEPEHRMFHRYTDIERFQNFPKVLVEGEEVVITEKIHGTNSRLALVKHDNENEPAMFLCGTHNNQVKQGRGIMYERPLQDEAVRKLLQTIYIDNPDCHAVILFGEIYGWVQSLRYGHGPNTSSFRAFDISVDGKYLDWETVEGYCGDCGVETVPVLYRGPFSEALLHDISGGKTTLDADHIREGVVVHPVVERWDPALRRVILKRISDEYTLKQDKISDSH